VTRVHAARDERAAWTGRVIDAHDGAPIPRAELEIVRPGFERSDLLAHATTNEAGRFELRCDERRRGDRLAVSSRLHATLHKGVPEFGEIEIALVLRRRALLHRLVAWAKERGAPFDAMPEPTPAHVARAAVGEPRAARWAGKVERAAFGPEEVDAQMERDVDQEAPTRNGSSAERLEKDVDDTPR
jgi:hypothetical protein